MDYITKNINCDGTFFSLVAGAVAMVGVVMPAISFSFTAIGLWLDQLQLGFNLELETLLPEVPLQQCKV